MNYGPTDPKASKAVSRGECGVSHGDAAPAIKEKEATESGECDVPHGDVASATKKGAAAAATAAVEATRTTITACEKRDPREFQNSNRTLANV